MSLQKLLRLIGLLARGALWKSVAENTYKTICILSEIQLFRQNCSLEPRSRRLGGQVFFWSESVFWSGPEKQIHIYKEANVLKVIPLKIMGFSKKLPQNTFNTLYIYGLGEILKKGSPGAPFFARRRPRAPLCQNLPQTIYIQGI